MLKKRLSYSTAIAAIATAAFVMTGPATAEDDVIVIGSITTLEGPFATGGQDAYRAMEMAFEAIDYTVAGKRIEWIRESSNAKPDVALARTRKLVEQDKNVRVVFKEFPILRDESEQAARVALAARMQGKYWEVHRDLITTKGLVNEAVALKVAENHGLDMAKLKADMASDEVKGELNRVKELAQKLSINGTPHFLVGDRAIGGAPENLYDVLETHVTELRKSGCAYC